MSEPATVVSKRLRQMLSRQLITGWFENAVPASSYAAAVDYPDQGFARPGPAIRKGSITGLSARYWAVITDGTVDVEVYVDTVATGFKVRLESGTINNQSTVDPGTYTFDAGAQIDVRYTSSSNLTPENSRLTAWIEIETDPFA
jgi:hypothetical protein